MTTLRNGPLNRPRGGSIQWQGDDPAATILRAEFFEAPAPPAGAQLVVTPGNYAVAGQPVTVSITVSVVSVTPASYAITGASSTTLWRRRAVVTPGSYGITGQAATTLWGRRVDTTAAAYAITGSPVELIYTTITPALTLDVTPGAYALTGATAGVRWAQRADVTPAAFAISGQPITVRRTYRAEVLPGAYTVAGAAATLSGPGDIAPEVTGDYQIIMRRRRR